MRRDATFGTMWILGGGGLGLRALQPRATALVRPLAKGMPEPCREEPPVRIFVMGGGDGGARARPADHGGSWRAEREWPLARTHYTSYYLHADGALLTPTPPRHKDRAEHDSVRPAHPVPTSGARDRLLRVIEALIRRPRPFWVQDLSPYGRMR